MMKILFLGTPQFAVPILEKLHQNFIVIGVVTQPDRPVGRKLVLTPPPVKTKAQELDLNVYQPEKAAEIVDLIPEEFDFIVTAAYGEYLPSKVIQMAKVDALNVHPSLLPKYRGATPMQSALLNGDYATGVSIIRMAKKMDAGEIFAQEKIGVPVDMKYPELEQECSKMGADLMVQVLLQYDALTPHAQDDKKATHCEKITKENGCVNWSTETAYDIYNKLRAFTPWPGVYTSFKNQKLSLLDFTVHDDPKREEHSPGTVFKDLDAILIQCETGGIQLKTLQLAGKNPTDIKSFLNGHHDFIGTVLK